MTFCVLAPSLHAAGAFFFLPLRQQTLIYAERMSLADVNPLSSFVFLRHFYIINFIKLYITRQIISVLKFYLFQFWRSEIFRCMYDACV